MRGLLLKDYYMALKYGRSVLLVVVVFLGAAYFNPANFFSTVYSVLLVSIMPMTLLSYDERERWDKYCTSLPYSRAEIVSEKYLFGLLLTLAIVLLECAVTIAAAAGNFVPEQLLELICVSMIVGLLAPSFVMPFAFKFGTEKGRIAYYIMIIAICGLGGAAGVSLSGDAATKLFASVFSKGGFLWGLGAAVLIYAGSWLLSIRFYQKREL